MKKLFWLGILCLIAFRLFAFEALLQSWDLSQDLKTLNSLNINIDKVNHHRGNITVYLRDEAEFQTLLDNGFSPQRLPSAYELFLEATAQEPPSRYSYYTVDEYNVFMQSTAASYPNLCQLYEFGRSVQNRPLYALKISDNVNLDENEAEIKLIGSIHGDEPVGYDMLIRLIKLLTENYGTDPRLTNIVNNCELWITPLMNPDGYVNHSRYNANNVDLNRNFPMPTGVQNPDGNPTAAETQAMMDYSLQHNFIIGLNYHGGALVINYPWDYTSVLAPDDALLIDLSLTYSMHNSPMYNSTEFDQGITNGAAWYSITGSMQDWNYAFTSNIELTAEIGNTKWPAASTLDTYWDQNRESLLSFIEYSQRGIKGTVQSAAGMGLEAEISIAGEGRYIRSSSGIGDYHRVILPGNYQITASAAGYIPESAEVVVPASGHVVQDFTLQTAEYTDLQGIIRDQDGYPVPNASLALNGESMPESAADGSFEYIDILEGNYRLNAQTAASGLHASELKLRKSALGSPLSVPLLPALFSDDFSVSMDQWYVSGNWNRVTESVFGWVLTDSPSGNYSNNSNTYARLNQPLDLSGITKPVLSFYAKWDLEDGYDFAYLEASANGSSWDILDSFTGNSMLWSSLLQYDLGAYTGGNLHLRFRLRSDRSVNADGIYIAQLKISGKPQNTTIAGDANSDGHISIQDITAILAHTCGEALPLPEMVAADVNLDGTVNAVDAGLVYLYTQEPGFRFPIQSQQPYELPAIETTYIMSGTSLLLSFANPQDLLSVELQDAPIVVGLDIAESARYLYHNNPLEGSFAMIGQSFPATFSFLFHSCVQTYNMKLYLNGQLFHIQGSGIEEETPPAPSWELSQNFPNPFNPETTIEFSLPTAQEISLEIYNLKGQQVAHFAPQSYSAGKHRIVWQALDNKGIKLPSGLYYYRLKSGKNSLTRKMVLSK